MHHDRSLRTEFCASLSSRERTALASKRITRAPSIHCNSSRVVRTVRYCGPAGQVFKLVDVCELLWTGGGAVCMAAVSAAEPATPSNPSQGLLLDDCRSLQ